MSNVAIIFICHDNDSISKVIHHNHFIILVGDKEISDEYSKYPKLTIARNLKDNIEEEKKLLTFTAWYAIIKNDLFLEYKYLCILEYDVNLNNSFEKCINDKINNDEVFNISFVHGRNCFLYTEANMNIIYDVLETKNINKEIVSQINDWGASTNQCMRRDILNDFIDWYSSSYSYIKSRACKMLSFYHERLYMIYLKSRNMNVTYLFNILHHLENRSHRE